MFVRVSPPHQGRNAIGPLHVLLLCYLLVFPLALEGLIHQNTSATLVLADPGELHASSQSSPRVQQIRGGLICILNRRLILLIGADKK